MEGSFRRLDTAVAEYLGRIEAEVRVQNELGHNAVERCDAVLKAAHRIARVAFLARILSLNAAAKSATIHDSAALDVIVQQLTRLSAETGELARRAIDAGNLLVQLLPALAESTSQVSNEVTAFSVSFRDSVQQLGPAAASLQRQLSDDLAKSNKRLRELVAMSRDALSALRFESDFLKTITAAGDTTRELVSLSEVPQRH
jgi:methyl-accepting chemotaxis protein